MGKANMRRTQERGPDAMALLEGAPLFDGGIVSHGFTPWMRDYDVVVDQPATVPGEARSYIEGRYRYRFTHCVWASVETAVADHVWGMSWDDLFTDATAWEAAGEPEGYLWAVAFMVAYPGAKYIRGSHKAREWTERVAQPMHEVQIITNGHDVRLVFHALRVHKIAQGSTTTDALVPIEPVEINAPAT